MSNYYASQRFDLAMLLGGPVHVTGNPGLARQKENALARSQKVKEETILLTLIWCS